MTIKTNLQKKIFRERSPKKTRLSYLRLDKNERVSRFEKNFFKKIMSKITHEHLTSYPEMEKIYDMIARQNKISKRSIVLTAGSDGGIRLCFELFTKPSDRIICLTPTFAMVNIYSKIFKVKQSKIGYDTKLKLNLGKFHSLLKKKISLVIFANPNSPTGTIIDTKEVIKILKITKRKKIPVLIDEAYYGFSRFSAANLVKKYDNLVVARTFSKAYGLAGCRAGYLVSNKKIAEKFFSLKPMYEINSIATIIIEEFLKSNEYKRYIKNTEKGKKFLISFLTKNNFKFIDTYANFIHVDFGKSKKLLLNSFKKNKILVKGGPGVKGFENFTRITLGPVDQMKKLINVVKKKINAR